MSSPDDRTLLKAGVVILLGLVFLVTAQSMFIYDHDMSLYLGLARSIAGGNGFVFDGEFNEQVPPGLPTLLAPLALVVDSSNIRAYQSAIVVFSVAALFLTWTWAREADRPLPWLTTILVAITPGFSYIATAVIYAEAPFMVASLAVLWWSERAVRPESRVRGGLALIPFVLAAIAVPALRTAGIALPAALLIAVVHDTIRRRWTKSSPAVDWRKGALTLALASTAFVVAWSRIVASQASGRFAGSFAPSYMAHLRLRSSLEPDLGMLDWGGMLLRLPQGIVMQVAHVAEMVTGAPWIKPFWLSPAIVLVLVLLFAGLYRALRREQPLAAWYTLVYGGIVSLWPFDEGQRFLVPIAPMLVSFIIDGARAAFVLAREATSRRRALVSGVLAALCVLTFLVLQPWSRDLSRQDQASIVAWGGLAVVWFVAQPGLARAAARVGTAMFAVWVAGCVLGNGYQLQSAARARLASEPGELRLAPVARAIDWLETNATRQAVVMTDYYAAVHLTTGLHAVPFPATGKAGHLTTALRCQRPDYLIVNDRLEDPYILPDEPTRFSLLEHAGIGRFELATSYPGGRIFRVITDGVDCFSRGQSSG